MHRSKRLRVSEVNPHLICVLCGGYYIDATTITECLHTFCKTCIVGYLEASKHCPVCDNLVHKTKPHLRLRSDHILQDLVYKLVPGLFQDEMKKRREFYKDEIDSGKVGENGIPEERERMIYSADEQISLILELSPDGNSPIHSKQRSSKQHRLEAADRRYLQCPAKITIAHLKKFIKMKFNLCDRYQLNFFHTAVILRDSYTLVDIAYIYSWRRKEPLRLYYSVFTNPAKRFKTDITETVPMETETSLNNSDMKTETSGYITDEEKACNELDKSTDSLNANISGTDSFTEIDTSDPESCHDNTDKTKTPTHITEESVKSITESETKMVESQSSNDSPKHYDKSIPKGDIDNISDKLQCDNKVEIAKSSKDSNNSTQVNEMHNQNTEAVLRDDDKDTIKNKNNENTHAFKESTPEIQNVTEPPPQISEPTTMESSMPTFSTSSTSTTESPIITSSDKPKSKIQDEDVSEPVVSSTQNTQGCQTEPPESYSDQVELPHSSDTATVISESVNHKSKVDVSCETDNIALARKVSIESVSVSTETECIKPKTDTRQKITIKDSFTDVCDLPNTDQKLVKTVDCSTERTRFPKMPSKDQSLTVDCSTDMTDIQMATNKRKSIDSATSTDTKGINSKKSEQKVPKRSYSYSGLMSSPKAEYLAQPLSPTKLTLKFSSPKSPKSPKVQDKSPSRAEPTGFQTQYQSFVMELPDKTYEFKDDSPTTVKPMSSKHSEPCYNQTPYTSTPYSYSDMTAMKTHSKSGRPRGRPPKNRSMDNIPMPIQKEKKHKSRSHSPKHRKHGEKKNVYSFGKFPNSVSDKHKNAQLTGSSVLKKSSPTTPYSWINKLDSNTKHVPERKHQKSKSVSDFDRPSSDLKIPKQVLYFSNGQYTLASASTINALKQSSPLSPTRTVSVSETLSSYKNVKLDNNTTKKEIKQLPVNTNGNAQQKSGTIKLLESKSKECSTKQPEHTFVSSHKTDSNQNKIIMSMNVSSSKETSRVTDIIAKPLPATSTVIKPPNTVPSSVHSTVHIPEYRHQSPFFTSLSGAKLGSSHRPSAHLNIPNLSSHFSGTHHLYSQGRYSNDRLGTPIYRSLSVSDKSPTTPTAAKFHDLQRLDSISPALGFMPFPAPFLGLSHMHAPLITSLPPSASPKGYSPDSTKSPTNRNRVIESPTNMSSYSMSQNPTNKNTIKTTSVNRKGKEKSIDTIISAITEMRTKKETSAQEQINGIDLSTKGCRQTDKSSSASVSADKVDTFAFTDDDNVRTDSRKTEAVQNERKSAI